MMTIRIAINGYGRIGRCVLRALFENGYNKNIELVAINNLFDKLNINAHLTQFDSIHGYFNHQVSYQDNYLIIGDHKIKFLSQRDPKALPWKELAVDVVLECSGAFTSKAKAMGHIIAGAKKVLVSAPCDNDVDATVVYGVNQHIITSDMLVISNGSCTTNCLAPIAQILNKHIGIEQGLMTTIHSFTSDQVLLDNYHEDLHRARAATLSMIPTKTGAAKAVGLVLPELQGKLDGVAVRVPTPNVSLVDFVFSAKRDVSVAEVNKLIKDAANSKQYQDVITNSEVPIVSSDMNHNRYSSIFDSTQTRVNGRLVKVFSWYDNEWGFSNRMLDNVYQLMK
jgi:glyceraldehyde 3-phosphate dehydrogenase